MIRTILLAGCVLCRLFAQAQFGPPVYAFETGTGYPGSITLADVDDDGDKDVVLNEGTFSSWYANDGSGTFGTRQLIGNGGSAPLTVVDIDGDGDLDVAAGGDAWPVYNDMGWYANDGAGNFTAMSQIAGTSSSLDLPRWADLDGDGDVDAVMRSASALRVFWNDGGTFTAGTTMGGIGSSGTLKLALDDADDDGDMDVLAFGSTSQNGYYENLGGGTFGAQTALPTNPPGLYTLWDHDNDGDQDLLVSSPTHWLINDGSANYTAGDTMSNNGGSGAVGDVDADGDPDFFWASTLNLNVEETRNDDSLFTNIEVEYVQGYSLQGVQFDVGDVNGDGHVDLAAFNGMGMIGWYAGDGANNWSLRHTIGTTLIWPHSGVAADFDLDGDLDIAATGFNDDRFAWYPNDGTGMMSAQLVIADNMNGPEDLVVFDLELDGDSDMLLWNQLASTVVRARNNGLGQFFVDSVAVQPGRLATADLNGDPFMDLVAGDAWYTNDGNGNFTLVQDLGLTAVTNVACGDMDGDQKDDIVFATGDQIIVVKEIVGATYTSTATAAPGFMRSALADLDVDGDLDIATISNGADYWYENDGSGNFTQRVWATSVPTSPVSLLARDVNGDGAPDLLWGRSNGYQREMYCSLNTGDGHFGAYSVIAPYGYYAIGLADLNGDLVEDLWAVNPRNIAWQENHYYDAFRLRGSVFQDVDMNGLLGALESKVPFQLVRTDANNILVWTNSAGNYDLPADTGPWQVWTEPPSIYQVTNDPDTLSATLSSLQPIAEGLNFGVAPYALDSSAFLTLTSSGNMARCNTQTVVWVQLQNIGTFIPENALVDVFVHPDLTVAYTTPPDSVVGDHYYWHVDSLGWFQQWSVFLALTTGPWGSNSTLTATVTYIAALPLIYTETIGGLVGCANDPNDKLVTPEGYGEAGAVPIDIDRLTYTVRFQNTGTDTAFTVVIKDTLDADLNWASMQIVGASHALTQIMVDEGGVATFRFQGIMLPDSNANEPASHGFVKYSIAPVDGAAHGTEITNTASIFFDWNEPVVTNTTLNTLVDCDLFSASIMWDGVDQLVANDGDAWQWFLDGDSIAGANAQALAISSSGNYTVQVTSMYGCVAISDPYQVISTNVIEESNTEMTVWPNPTSGDFVVTINEATADAISLIDATGREVRVIPVQGAQRITVERKDLVAGIYLLRVLRDGSASGSASVVVK